jgi:hypothetical protein
MGGAGGDVISRYDEDRHLCMDMSTNVRLRLIPKLIKHDGYKGVKQTFATDAKSDKQPEESGRSG